MRPFSIKLTELEAQVVGKMVTPLGMSESKAIQRWAQRLITNAANDMVDAHRKAMSRPTTTVCTCHLGEHNRTGWNPLCSIHGDPRDTNILGAVAVANRIADGIPGFTGDIVPDPNDEYHLRMLSRWHPENESPSYREQMKDAGRGDLLR